MKMSVKVKFNDLRVAVKDKARNELQVRSRKSLGKSIQWGVMREKSLN